MATAENVEIKFVAEPKREGLAVWLKCQEPGDIRIEIIVITWFKGFKSGDRIIMMNRLF